MRKQTIGLFALILFAHALCGQEPGTRSLASLNFDAGSEGDCSVSVNATRADSSGPPTQVLMIACKGREILSYPTQDTLIDLFLDYPHDDRVFARWEGGSHVRFTVFRISKQLSVGTVVFDKQLEGAPDVLNTPDALLVHNGKRWITGQAISLPTSTNVYLWTGEQYVLTASWKWKEAMRYEDRFCVLDPQKLSCPVTPIPIK